MARERGSGRTWDGEEVVSTWRCTCGWARWLVVSVLSALYAHFCSPVLLAARLLVLLPIWPEWIPGCTCGCGSSTSRPATAPLLCFVEASCPHSPAIESQRHLPSEHSQTHWVTLPAYNKIIAQREQRRQQPIGIMGSAIGSDIIIKSIGLLMLKIGKKEELKVEGATSVYSAEEQTEQTVLKVIREKPYLNWQQIHSLLRPLPSLPASIIAEILHKTLSTLHEEAVQTALDNILQIVAFPHDSRELRHSLKTQFRIDGELLLYLLWQRKEAAGSVYLAEVAADCCTAQLMLANSQATLLWKKHLTATADFLRSKERLAGQLEQGGEGESAGREAFRRFVIPL